MATKKPSYIKHDLDESKLTIDWFFAKSGFTDKKIEQFILIIIGWFFAILPIVITVSALTNRHDNSKGWWSYAEGFHMWDRTYMYLTILTATFIILFLALFWINNKRTHKRKEEMVKKTPEYLARNKVANNIYDAKFGSKAQRQKDKFIKIDAYNEFTTYEIRYDYKHFNVGGENIGRSDDY